jgi:hypothetical protein
VYLSTFLQHSYSSDSLVIIGTCWMLGTKFD